MRNGPLSERLKERAHAWGLSIQDTLETPSSLIAFGNQGSRPVVLKVSRQPGDEWRSGEVLAAFDGRGMVRAYDYVEGAVLLERLDPGTSLSELALNGRDDEATEILAEVIEQMLCFCGPASMFTTVEKWGQAFQRYRETHDQQVPADLVEQGQHAYQTLCASQQEVRLLHGDLQHYNVLFDSDRGWVAIDPKGVVGEIEFEIGAALRNPYARPELFASAETVNTRIKIFAARLKLDEDRMLAWSFSQAVLSAIWSVEDGFTVDAKNPALMLARAIQPLLD